MQKTAMTLTELLVASILIGIVMLGVTAFTVSIKSLQESSSKSVLMSMRTAASMSHITRNSSLATGSLDDVGIVMDPLGTPPYWSFRQDRNVLPTPNDYSDDSWVIYWRGTGTPSSEPTTNLYTCVQPEGAGSGEGSIPNTVGNRPCSEITNSSSNRFLLSGNLVNITFTDPVTTGTSFTNIVLITRYDPSVAADPLKNPESSVTMQVSPQGHSW